MAKCLNTIYCKSHRSPSHHLKCFLRHTSVPFNQVLNLVKTHYLRRRGGRIPTMGCLDPSGEDVRKTWRRFDVPTPKSSNSDDDLPENYPVVKNMLHRLAADLTLDPGTAHRPLLVSADHRSVQLAPPPPPRPVETADAACGPDSSGEDKRTRMKPRATTPWAPPGSRCAARAAGAVWAVEDRGGHLWALTAPDPTPLGGAGPLPWRIRIDLDWERGRVAFSDARSLDLLFAFQGPGPVGERVFPLLCTRHAHATPPHHPTTRRLPPVPGSPPPSREHIHLSPPSFPPDPYPAHQPWPPGRQDGYSQQFSPGPHLASSPDGPGPPPQL
ncbi:unnamed protein product [Nyctereutes procyonoides]|uniref:(raccoon dog) hypothetical protein n=1 Tax=Nyctereutes procyonoides TaxID=34880 RepID=A0A811Z2A8_NYCPR|nr:unnamed protein product [Nyctereutes procyonoides]